MVNNNLFLILASGEIKGIGYWIIEKTTNENPVRDNRELLECHRMELIGEESANQILFAINLNLSNLHTDFMKDGFIIEKPPKGISFSIPLSLLENIYDFWVDVYKENTYWDTCLGLLKIKQRFSLKELILNKGLTGNAKKWAPEIEKLHQYRPEANPKCIINAPMWE